MAPAAAPEAGQRSALVASAKRYYATRPADFINHWVTTHDPRRAAVGQPVYFPLVMFDKQLELIDFIMTCLKAETSGMVEKSRDMGATWVCCAISVWFWLFHTGSAIGWG